MAALGFNTSDYKIRHGAGLDTEMLELTEKATRSIDEVRKRLAHLRQDSEVLAKNRKLYLDAYRRKPKN
mgnify:CR=1 FL=1